MVDLIIVNRLPSNILWTPANISSATVMWFYSAHDPSKITFSSGILISQLNSHIGAFPLTQATVGNQPSYDSVNRYIYGDGVSDSLKASSGFSATAGSRMTRLIGFRYNNSSSVLVSADYGSSANSSLVRTTTATGSQIRHSYSAINNNNLEWTGTINNNSNYSCAITAQANTTSAQTSNWDSTSATQVCVSVNGSITNGADLSNNTWYNDTSLLPTMCGSPNRSLYGSAPIYYDLMCNGLLSFTEVQKVEGWWAHEWGFQSALITGHPYKTTPPYV